jgi:hypothetical protein
MGVLGAENSKEYQDYMISWKECSERELKKKMEEHRVFGLIDEYVEDNNEIIRLDFLLDAAKKGYDMDEEQVKEIIIKLKQQGLIMETNPNCYITIKE